MNRVFILFAVFFILTAPATAAANETADDIRPGWITPSSGLYGLEVAWDNTLMSIGLKQASTVVQERAAEARAMVAANNTGGMQRAIDQMNAVAMRARSGDESGLVKAAAIISELTSQVSAQAENALQQAYQNLQQAQERASQGRQNASNRSNRSDDLPGDDTGAPQQQRAPTPAAGQGVFDLMVSDAPASIEEFDYLEVSFSEARVFPAGVSAANGSEGENDSDYREQGFRMIQLNGSTVDLTQVVGADAQSLVQTPLDEGRYTKIELYVSGVTAEANNTMVDVKVPSGKLMITKPFTITEGETTRFVFDIQVALRGNQQNNQGYILQPVISESGVVGEDVEIEEEGDEAAQPEEPQEQPGEEEDQSAGNETADEQENSTADNTTVQPAPGPNATA